MLEVFAVSLLYRTRASLTWSHKPCSQLLSCAGAAGAKLHAEIYQIYKLPKLPPHAFLVRQTN